MYVITQNVDNKVNTKFLLNAIRFSKSLMLYHRVQRRQDVIPRSSADNVIPRNYMCMIHVQCYTTKSMFRYNMESSSYNVPSGCCHSHIVSTLL